MNIRIAVIFCAAFLLSQSAGAADWWADTYSDFRHPLLGTAFCYSSSKNLCKAKPFRSKINLVSKSHDYGRARLYAIYAIAAKTNITFEAVADDGLRPTIQFYADATTKQSPDRMDTLAKAELYDVSDSVTHGHRVCDITANRLYMDRLSERQQIAVYIHEMGHCLGLDHYPQKAGAQEVMYPELTCDMPGYYSPTCNVTPKFQQVIHEGYFFKPYGYYWWNDDPNWIRWVDYQNGGEYKGTYLCGILGLACIYIH